MCVRVHHSYYDTNCFSIKSFITEKREKSGRNAGIAYIICMRFIFNARIIVTEWTHLIMFDVCTDDDDNACCFSGTTTSTTCW